MSLCAKFMTNLTRNVRMHEKTSDFKIFIRDILKRFDIVDDKVDLIVGDADAMLLYTRAFTHASYDETYNYELMETLGDATVNDIIVNYYYEKYSDELTTNTKKGKMSAVGILTRLKCIGVSTRKFCVYGERMGFDPFVRHRLEPHFFENNKNKIFEDIFESFMCANKLIFDTLFHRGIGYIMCTEIVENILRQHDNSTLSVRYLYDSKSLLNENFTIVFKKKGRVSYYFLRDVFENTNHYVSSIILEFDRGDGRRRTIDVGREYDIYSDPHPKKNVSEKNVAAKFFEYNNDPGRDTIVPELTDEQFEKIYTESMREKRSRKKKGHLPRAR